MSGYLLNLGHPVGGPKAARLRRHNFDAANLRDVLVEHGRTGTLDDVDETAWVTRFSVVNALPTPLNTYLQVRTVWEVRPSSPDTDRLIILTFED